VELVTIEIEDLFGAGINAEPVSVDLQSFMPLRTWVGLKLIDDPSKNTDLLAEAFCDGYYGPAAEPMHQLLERIEQRQADLSLRVVDVQRQVWAEAFCDSKFFTDAYRWLDEAMRLTNDHPVRQTHVRRERIIIDSVFLWLESHLRDGHPAESPGFPAREEILRRHREDWDLYIATVFNEDGQKLARPFIENGLTLMEKLKLEDTEFEHRPVAITDADVNLDGQLNEAFWGLSKPSRLVPRDPTQANDNPTSIRLAWTPEALYLGVDQPADKASAILGVTLMGADRKGVQLSLYATKNNGPQSLNAYYYDYDENETPKAARFDFPYYEYQGKHSFWGFDQDDTHMTIENSEGETIYEGDIESFFSDAHGEEDSRYDCSEELEELYPEHLGKGYWLMWTQGGKGSCIQTTIEGVFEPKKLKVLNWDIQGTSVVTRLVYDGDELDDEGMDSEHDNWRGQWAQFDVYHNTK
jgi:hypothetical protein